MEVVLMKITMNSFIERTVSVMKHFKVSFKNKKRARFEMELPEEVVKKLDEHVAFYQKYYEGLDGHSFNRTKYINSILMDHLGLAENKKGKIESVLTHQKKDMFRYAHIKNPKEFFETGVQRRMIPENEMEKDLNDGVKPKKKKKTTTK